MSRLEELLSRLFSLLNYTPQGRGGRNGNVVYPPGDDAPEETAAFANNLMARAMQLLHVGEAARKRGYLAAPPPLFLEEDLIRIRTSFVGPDLEAFTELYDTATALVGALKALPEQVARD